MDEADDGSARLLVVVDGTGSEALPRWLSETCRAATQLVTLDKSAPLALADVVLASARRQSPQSPHLQRFVELPLDGPVRALRYALRAIREHQERTDRAPVVLRQRNGTPPAPGVLVEVSLAGLLPAVDLRSFAWATGDAVWVAAGPGLTRVPRRRESSDDEGDLARLLMGLSSEGGRTPLLAHLESAVKSGVAFDSDQWQEVLLAAYVESCARCVLRAPAEAL